MSIMPQVHALWSHAAKLSQLTARRLGWTKRVDRAPEHERVEQVLERALRDQSRKAVEVLRQELLTTSAYVHRPVRMHIPELGAHLAEVPEELWVRRADMLAVVDNVLAAAQVKQASARKRKGKA